MVGLLLAAQTGQGGSGALFSLMLPFVLMAFVFYFLIMRPQRKKEQERLAMLRNIQKNDHVLTSGGIYGVVLSIKDNEVILKIDETTNAKIRLARSAIVGIEKRAVQEEPS